MKVLVLGQGGREHALAWKFARSNRITGLFCAPGNPGTAELGTNIDLDPTDSRAVLRAAKEHRIDLVFIGPEAPLAAGVADTLREAEIAVIGPGAEASRLESSKSFAKQFMTRNGVPTAAARMVANTSELDRFITENPGPVVVKMDGLASGKGVREFECASDARGFAVEALEVGPVLLEERLSGFEISVFVLVDRNSYQVLPPSADYKKAGEGGVGPNTGGMGAIAPVPWLSTAQWSNIIKEIVEPSVTGLHKESLDYVGVLYIGVMVTEQGAKVLEYNVRFGDPETQVVLPLLRADILDICEAMLEGRIGRIAIETDDVLSVGIVIASEGYPDAYEKGREIRIDEIYGTIVEPRSIDRLLFHSGTNRDGSGSLSSNGGRVFTCVSRDSDLMAARAGAYELASAVRFEGSWFRTDIASRVFGI